MVEDVSVVVTIVVVAGSTVVRSVVRIFVVDDGNSVVDGSSVVVGMFVVVGSSVVAGGRVVVGSSVVVGGTVVTFKGSVS